MLNRRDLLTFVIAALPTAAAEFEVASIKPVKPGSGGEPHVETSADGITIRSRNVLGLLMWAWEIPQANRISGPGWMLTEDFDIIAKAPAPASTAELRTMLQNLLRDRFRLTLHIEEKIVPLYSLVVDKNGLKIQEVQTEARAGIKLGIANGIVTCQMVNRISELVAILPQFLEGRPVEDKTGLTAVYDLTLKVEIDPDQKNRAPQTGVAFTGFGYTAGLFDALQALGLKLESTRGPVTFLVVDHIERPSAN